MHVGNSSLAQTLLPTTFDYLKLKKIDIKSQPKPVLGKHTVVGFKYQLACKPRPLCHL